MAGTDKVLVYHYRAGGTPVVVKDGLDIIAQEELEEILREHPDLQLSSKPIPRGAAAVEIHQRDLLTPSQVSANEKYPNIDANVAGVKLPLKVALASAFGGYEEMAILSKKV